MSGYIKYFDNCGKNMSFIIEHDSVFIKNNEIWDRIKGLRSEKFHRKSIYGEKYTKTKVKTFNGVVRAIFLFDKIFERRHTIHWHSFIKYRFCHKGE